MDIFYPFITRPLLPAQPRKKLITPVGRYTRMLPVQSERQQHADWPAVSVPEQLQQPVVAGAPTEPTLLQTSHHETPPADQHADADGHLDLYI